MDPAGLPALHNAIRHLHGVPSVFVESVPIKETHDGAVLWQGEVQVFDIAGHPLATRCYAWSYATTGTKRKFVAVLGVPPITDARKAVQAVIVNESRKQEKQ